MAIENPSRNPFLGIYQRPQSKQPSNLGMGQPEDFLSSEEVIGRPDAQNTAQRAKAGSKGLKEAYESLIDPSKILAEMKAGYEEIELGKKRGGFENAPKDVIDQRGYGLRVVKTPKGTFKYEARTQPMKVGEDDTPPELKPSFELMLGAGAFGKMLGTDKQQSGGWKFGENQFAPQRPSTFVGGPQNVSPYETMGTRLDSFKASQGQPIAAPTPRLDAMAARNATSRQNALTPGTDFSGRKINTDPSADIQQRLNNKQYGNGVYSPEYMDIYNSF
jgi:hypothetical protein